MSKIKPQLRGAALAFLTLSLIACASKPIVQTKTVEVERAVNVALPAVMTEGVEDAPVPDPLDNEGLIGVAEGERCRKTLANCKLERIEALQPGGARRPAKWCERQKVVCRGAK